MSIIEEPTQTPDINERDVQAPSSGLSVRERAIRRREELSTQQTFTLPVEGFEDILEAVYRTPTSYEELRRAGRRNEKLKDDDEREQNTAADTLITFCVDLITVGEDGSKRSTGLRWSPAAVTEFLGVDLPEGATARNAVRAGLPSLSLMAHFQAWGEAADERIKAINKDAEGESAAA